MELNKIMAILQNLNCDVEEINIVDEETIEIDGEEFLVLTDDEAETKFYEYQKNLWDEMGLESFTDSARQYIINNFVDENHLFNIVEELMQSYIDDIRYESGRLEEEMEENNCETEEDYLEYLCSEEHIGDKAQYLIDNFGIEQFTEMVKDDIDLESVVDYVKECDGRGITLASYDGDEREEEVDGEYYYIYRI